MARSFVFAATGKSSNNPRIHPMTQEDQSSARIQSEFQLSVYYGAVSVYAVDNYQVLIGSGSAKERRNKLINAYKAVEFTINETPGSKWMYHIVAKCCSLE